MSRYMAILARRAIRWNSVLAQQSLPDGGTMKRFVRKGVPAQYRGKVNTEKSNERSNTTYF